MERMVQHVTSTGSQERKEGLSGDTSTVTRGEGGRRQGGKLTDRQGIGTLSNLFRLTDKDIKHRASRQSMTQKGGNQTGKTLGRQEDRKERGNETE